MFKLTLISSLARIDADLSHMDLKGIDHIVTHPGLSPVLGFVALHSFLPNRRFFGHYGDNARGLFCKNPLRLHIGAKLRERADCPMDWNAEWLQRLFPSQDGSTFSTNQLESDFVSWLTPRLIGLVLGLIARSPPLDDLRSDSGIWTTLTEDLASILHKNINEKGFIHYELDRLNKQISKAREQSVPNSAVSTESLTESGKLLGILDTKTQTLLERLKDLETSRNDSLLTSPRKHDARSIIRSDCKRSHFLEIANLFVNAIKESRIGASRDHYFYPPYTPEQALIAFMLRRIDSKADLVDYLLALEDSAEGSILRDPAQREQFIQDSWYSGPEGASRRENLIAELYKRGPATLFPELLAFKRVKHGTVSYSDCGETSLRNFFNFILFNPETSSYDLRIIDELEAQSVDPKLHVAIAIRDFYRVHFDPKISTSNQHVEWALNVVSRHEGVHYATSLSETEPQFQIKGEGSARNMFHLLGHLLFEGEERAKWFNLDLDRKIQLLSTLISRPSFQIKTSRRESVRFNKLSMSISFQLNEKPAFEWRFSHGHIIMVSLLSTALTWAEWEASRIFESEEEKELLPVTPLLATWSATVPEKSAIFFRKDPMVATNYMVSLKIRHLRDPWEFFEAIASDAPSFLGPFAQRIGDKLITPENDPVFVSRIIYAMRKAGYRFGIPAALPFHSPAPDILAQLRPETLAIKIFGREVSIGEEITELMSTTWNDAFEYCLNLNSIERREVIRAKILERERELSVLRAGKDPHTATPEMEEIYQIHSIGGFSLLGPEQYLHLRTVQYASPALGTILQSYWTTMADTAVSVRSCFISHREGLIRCGFSD
jgi:hypothetical protein